MTWTKYGKGRYSTTRNGREYFLKGKRHREDGPAFEGENHFAGEKAWWINDQLHRTDGPAVIRADGREEWYIEGKKMTESEAKLYIFQKWAIEGRLL